MAAAATAAPTGPSSAAARQQRKGLAVPLNEEEHSILGQLHTRITNVMRTSEKKRQELAVLNPELSKNKLVVPVVSAAAAAETEDQQENEEDDAEAPTAMDDETTTQPPQPKKRKAAPKVITELIVAENNDQGPYDTSPYPPAPTATVRPSTQLTPLKTLLSPGQEDPNVIFYDTKVPFITGLNGQFPSFYKDYFTQMSAAVASGNANGVLKLNDATATTETPSSTAVTKPHAPKKSASAANSSGTLSKKAAHAIANGPIPTFFGLRGGNVGMLPLYGANSTTAPVTVPLGADHTKAYLYLKAGVTLRPFAQYMFALVEDMKRSKIHDAGPNATGAAPPPADALRYKISWNYVQEMAFCEPINPVFQPCIAGAGCVLWGIPHPRGMFLPQQWIPPWMLLRFKQKGALPKRVSRYCLACMMNYHNVVRNVSNLDAALGQPPGTIGDRTRLAEIVPEWEFRIGVPGEYNQHAFRMNPSGSADKTSHPIRELVLSQLRPSTREVDGKVYRRFVEDTSLQYREGSHRLGLQLTNPGSHPAFEISTLTNERLLLTYIFRDVSKRLATITGMTALPDYLKIFRLAFVPFEVGLELIQNEHFQRQWLPMDFASNTDYLFRHFDLVKQVKNPLAFGRPQFQGHLVFYLLHVRMNAALQMMLPGGVLDWVAGCIRNKKQLAVGAGLEGEEATAAAAELEPIEEEFELPEVATPYEPNNEARLPSKNLEERLRMEVENMRSKLRTFLLEHEKLSKYLLNKLNELGRIDDIHLLDQDDGALWAEIKPDSTCVGPLFVEDRIFMGYKPQHAPSVQFSMGSGHRALELLRHWLVVADATSAAALPVCTAGGVRLAWAGKDHCRRDSREHLTEVLYLTIGTDRVPLEILLGDFSGLVWWLRQPEQELLCERLHASCEHFANYGWAYPSSGGKEHISTRLKRGAWRDPVQDSVSGKQYPDTYVILVATQLASYCAERLMEPLQELIGKLLQDSTLRVIQTAQACAQEQLLFECPAQISSYVPSEPLQALYNEMRDNPEHQLSEFLNRSLRELQETTYHLHKFSLRHMPLVQAMLGGNCPKGNPSDSALTQPTHAASATEDRLSISLYEIYYPYDDRVVSEDTLVDCAAFETRLAFYASEHQHQQQQQQQQQQQSGSAASKAAASAGRLDHTDVLLDAQIKSLPLQSHKRDFTKHVADLASSNETYARHLTQNLLCSALGAYRHAMVRPRFMQALELYAPLSVDQLDGTIPKLQQGIFQSCASLVFNALRENTCFQIRKNPAYYQAMLLDYNQYSQFESDWLMPRMESFRTHLRESPGITLPQLERLMVSTLDPAECPTLQLHYRGDQLFSWLCARLASVLAKKFVTGFMKDCQFEWPEVLVPSLEMLQQTTSLVQSLQLNDQLDTVRPFYDVLVNCMGCSLELIDALQQMEQAFYGYSKAQEVETNLVERLLSEPERWLLLTFLYLVQQHASIRVVPLSPEIKQKQLLAVQTRHLLFKQQQQQQCGEGDYEDPTGPKIPLNMLSVHFCSIASCRRRKTPMVQVSGLKYFGNTNVSWNMDRMAPVCHVKKPTNKTRKNGGTTTAAGGASADTPAAVAAVATQEEDAAATDDKPNGGTKGARNCTKSLPIQLKSFFQHEQDHVKPAQMAYTTLMGTSTEPPVVTPGNKSALEKINRVMTKRLNMISDIEKAARKEALQFVNNAVQIPCEDSTLDAYLVLGQYVERSHMDSHQRAECYTLCPSCGCHTLYRPDFYYANGLTCTDCDWKLRQDLTRPDCIGCNRLCLAKELERRKRKKTRSGDITAGIIEVDTAAHVVETRKEPLAPKAKKRAGASSFAARKSAASVASASSAGANPRAGATTASVGGKRKGGAGGVTGSGAEVELLIATNTQEDRAMRQKRTSKQIQQMCPDEWYRYTVLDPKEARMREVYVCGSCNYPRPWLRELESSITTVEMHFLITCQQSLRSLDDACKLLAIGAHLVTSRDKAHAEQAAMDQSKVLAKRKPKAPRKKRAARADGAPPGTLKSRIRQHQRGTASLTESRRDSATTAAVSLFAE